MKLLLVLAALVAVSLASTITIEERVVGRNGGILFLTGQLGSVPTPVDPRSVRTYITETLAPVFGFTGRESFLHVKTNVDTRNNTHVFFQQFVEHHGSQLEVDGGEIIVHANEQGAVFAISSSVLAFHADAPYADVKIQHVGKPAITAAMAKEDLEFLSNPELVFLLHEEEAFFAYRATVAYEHPEMKIPYKSRVFVSPQSGDLIVEFPLVYTIENRTVYTANQKTQLPGTLVRSEGSLPVNDQSVNQAYANSGICYEFYFKAFGRDSYDNKGATLISTVHYDKNYNNAFWNGIQMVYGDGDGINFSDFAGDLSVVCHELTHAVISSTANLRYSGESGALNEGIADMMGASAVIYDKGGLHANSWEIGSECYLAGDALRYMNNPVKDGVSRDYYPNRYIGILDNGGVHWNSGIANLWFVLLVQGGVHPQQRTTNYVDPAGIIPALDITYSALVNYMTTTTTFAQARAATATATKVLFPGNSAVLNSVTGAWTAVGVN